MPRVVVVQGVLSGVVFAVGYGIGNVAYWLWKFMELRDVTGRLARILSWILVAALTLTTLFTLGRMTTWQNSIRVRMEMEPIDSVYPASVLFVAVVTALVVLLLARLVLFAASRRWTRSTGTCPAGSRSSWAARSS